MIPVLYCQKDSIYKKLNCDVYDFNRNAFNYSGFHPVICHPPCRKWSRLRFFSTAPGCEMLTAVHSVILVQKLGGVLEHPANSVLWNFMNLPLPGQKDKYGFSISLNQHWFGHLCKKNTWLYIVGLDINELPDYTLNFNAIENHIGRNKKIISRKIEVSKHQRDKTPIKFAEWLIEIQKLIALGGLVKPV